MEIIVIILLILYFALFAYCVIRELKILFLFRKGRNPYSRICRKCGATQDQYEDHLVFSDEPYTYWSEVHPLGNNKNCECRKYAESRG